MPSQPSPYSWLMLAGIACTLFFWGRLARRDDRLFIIYLAALCSAFVGAKIVYLLAEGWLFWGSPQRWLVWATGKTILGALLGGYLGVEMAKKVLDYRTPTGDFFAFVAPVGIILGRLGCFFHGCCLGAVCQAPHWWTRADAQGVPRWPAVPLEIGFNLVLLGFFLGVRRRRQQAEADGDAEGAHWLSGQLFHLYLLAYGLFRFFHEFERATPRLMGGLTGYHLAALAVAALGAIGYLRRARSTSAPPQNLPASATPLGL